jgi:DNA-binding CsgD family transcriptional regulator/signal transduction histidine kinase
MDPLEQLSVPDARGDAESRNGAAAALLDRPAILRNAAVAVTRDIGFDVGMAAERVDDIDTLVVRSVVGARTDKMVGLVIPAGTGLGGQVTVLRQTIVVDDYFRSTSISHDYDASWMAEDLVSGVAVPISWGHELYGVLYGAARDGGAPAREMIEAMERLARSTGSALETADRMQELVDAAVHAERRRIAVSLHESVRSSLIEIAAATRDLRTNPDCPPIIHRELEQIEARLSRATGELRQGLRALPPDEVALGVSLQMECSAFTERTGVPARTILLGDLPHLEPARARALLQMAREALLGIEKQHRASSVAVTLQFTAGIVTLLVADDELGVTAHAGHRVLGSRRRAGEAPVDLSDAGLRTLVEAIRSVVAGRPDEKRARRRDLGALPSESEPPQLTARELEVMQRASIGETNPEIAAAMGISRNTVKGYMTAALQKLGARNRIEAFTRAREAGLL